MKFKLINSFYDEDRGISSATIATDLGFFTGYASLHPNDKEVASNFCGCRYAEQRAVLKYIRKRVSLYAQKLKTLNNYLLYLKTRQDFELSDCKKIYRYMNHIQKERDIWKEKERSLQLAIDKSIEERDFLLTKFNKNKK